jgi:glycosyltransferase involved in cell wall biosynthesis
VNAPRVISFKGDETGCHLWRCLFPFGELRRRGYFAHFKSKDDPECLAPEWPYLLATRFDAVILPRMAWSDYAVGQRYIRAMHQAGLTVIYELDDDALSPAIVQRQYLTHDVERDKGLAQLEQDRLDRIQCIRQCDGVTVTTRRLKTIVGQYTDAPIEVVPNAIDTRWWRQVTHTGRRVIPPLTIGWAGGSRYPEDLVPMAEAWGRIARTDDSVRFVVQGHLSPVIAEAVPAHRLRVIPWLPIEQYPVGLLNIDIGCCSVAPKLFNTAKTPIKLWEFTMSGAVSVVSPTLYGPVAQDGEDCLVAETADQWESALRRLIASREMRKRLWRNQRRRVATEHSLEANWWRWPLAWSNIIDQWRAEQARPRVLVAS